MITINRLFGFFLLTELFAFRPIHAAESTLDRKSIFPSAQEKFSREWDRVIIEKYIQPCFVSTSNTDYPSGYARLSIKNGIGDTSVSLERATFRGDFVSSCVLSKGIEYTKAEPELKNWTYIHLASECKSKTESLFYRPDNVDCKLTVFLNNLSGNKELQEIIEGHWKSERVENPALYSTLQIANILRILTQLSK